MVTTMVDVLKDALENAVDNYNEIMGSIDTSSNAGRQAKIVALGEIERCFVSLINVGERVSIVDIDVFTKKVQYEHV